MSKFKRISTTILGVLAIWTTYSFAVQGTITTDGVRVRKEASTDSEIITSLNNGAIVEVEEKSGEWYKIKYDDYEGYSHGDYIKVEEQVVTDNTQSLPTDGINENTEVSNNKVEEIFPEQVNTSNSINVYIIPSISSSIILNIEAGKTININKKINNWYYITYENKTGWVRINTLNATSVTNNEQTENNNQQTTSKGYINVDLAIMRDKASTEGAVITTLEINTEVNITGEENDWYKIEVGEYKGYIAKRLVFNKVTETTSRSLQEPRKEDNTITKTGYVSVGIANIRENATSSSKIIKTLKQKTEIKIIKEENDFYKIDLNDSFGYIAKRLVVDSLDDIVDITTEPVAKVTSSNVETSSTSESSIVNCAEKYLGYSYVLGGTTPSGGFDCSGFVYYVCNSCGYSISRSCQAQANSGVAVSKEELQPGDLLFFDNTSDGSIGHVGIYIGGGRFIHAANSRRGIVTDTIESGYYYTYYHSARRIV